MYVLQMLRNVTAGYVALCKDLQPHSRRGRPGPLTALMHVSAAHGAGVVMVCKPGVTARACAAAHIARLDAATQVCSLTRTSVPHMHS